MEPKPAGDTGNQDYCRAYSRLGGYSIGFQPGTAPNAPRYSVLRGGCVRLQQPLSPVIRLGATKLLAIGVRSESIEHPEDATNQKDPSLAHVLGILFNVMFLDHLATDTEHLAPELVDGNWRMFQRTQS
jgi:hypothetical protein